MKYLVLVLLIPLLLTSCLQQDEIKNEPSTNKQVFLDWEQVNDPNIPIELLNIQPVRLSPISDSNKSHFIFRYKIEHNDFFDIDIYLEFYTSVFDSDGNHIISFDSRNGFGFLTNDGGISHITVGGGTNREVSFAEAESYSSSITFINHFSNNGEIFDFDRNIIKQYLANNYPNVDVDSYIELLDQTPDFKHYIDYRMNSDT